MSDWNHDRNLQRSQQAYPRSYLSPHCFLFSLTSSAFVVPRQVPGARAIPRQIRNIKPKPQLPHPQASDHDKSILGELMAPSLQCLNKHRAAPDLWMWKLSHKLIIITHKQWTYWNSTAHYKPSGNKTAVDHNIINQNVLSLII
jgi:hypothetical protein